MGCPVRVAMWLILAAAAMRPAFPPASTYTFRGHQCSFVKAGPSVRCGCGQNFGKCITVSSFAPVFPCRANRATLNRSLRGTENLSKRPSRAWEGPRPRRRSVPMTRLVPARVSVRVCRGGRPPLALEYALKSDRRRRLTKRSLLHTKKRSSLRGRTKVAKAGPLRARVKSAKVRPTPYV